MAMGNRNHSCFKKEKVRRTGKRVNCFILQGCAVQLLPNILVVLFITL